MPDHARVHGHVDPGFEPVAQLFGRLFRSPGRGGGSFVVRYRDRNVVDIWAGVANPQTGREWERDSLGLSFSTSKGVASTVIHRLADRGLLSYDEPVAAYWPEFAAGGKGRILVRELLSHRAALDHLGAVVRSGKEMLDHIGNEERLAAATPAHRPGAPAYHAITFGWLLAGLARRITGLGMEELVQQEINQPLGIDGLHFGAPTRGGARVTAPVGSMGRLPRLAPLGGFLPLARRGIRSMYVPGMDELFRGPRMPILDTEMPAVNGMFTAESLATMYGALANRGMANGRRLLSEETSRIIRRVQTLAPDRNLAIPMTWRLGYHQAMVPGVWLPKAIGHYGLSGSGGWADPVSGMSVAFVSNRIYPVAYAMGDLALIRLSRLAVAGVRRAGGAVPETQELADAAGQ